MRRWFSELLHPSRKCARVGHVMTEDRLRVFLETDMEKDIFWRHYVAMKAVEVTPRCRRCGHREETRIENRRGLSGLTMSEDKWDELREKGRTIA